MHKATHFTASVLLLILVAVSPVHAEVKMPAFFSDGMVLQRDTVAPIWGTATPGELITAQFSGHVASATADSHGQWRATFKSLPAGGPFVLTIKGSNSALRINNVLVGDVWFCWGDSNMAQTMTELGNLAKNDLAASADPLLHCFTTRMTFPPSDPAHDQPSADVEGTWAASDPTTTPKFTAYGYYFAKELRQQFKIPIGIINCSYGGAGIETWMPPETSIAAGFPEIGDRTAQYAALDEAAPKFLQQLSTWESKYGRQDPGDKGVAAGFADPKTDISHWTPIKTPGDWTPLSLANGGVVWIRRTVDLPADAAGHDLTLHLGDIKNTGEQFGNILGTVYVNGQEAGRFGEVLKRIYMGSSPPANVNVPGKLIIAGPNVIAIRIFTQQEKTHSFGGGTRLLEPLIMPSAIKDPGWVGIVEAQLPPLPPDALASRPEAPPSPSVMRLPGIFYNHLLHPFVGYGIKGIAAYHGESNVHVGEAYRRLFPAFIQFCRTQWKADDLPFCFTQIADVYPPRTVPGISDWAELRESQLVASRQVPHTAMTVTIDIGDADVHLKDEKNAAHRLVLAALATAYGQTIESSGPVYDSMNIEQNKIRLRFSHLAGGLVAKDGPLKQFSIAGADRHFVWADATLDGDTVVVSSAPIASPAAVRYAWAENPAGCNLFNKAGLPASPFRTDDWPLRTLGNTVKDLLLSLLHNDLMEPLWNIAA